MEKDALFKIDFIEKWIMENRKETILSQPIEVIRDNMIFDAEIFKDKESSILFFFLVDRYAVNKSVSQFSQIFHWMHDTDCRIKNNKGSKYRAFVKSHFNLINIFARIEPKKTFETPALNEFYKEFKR